MSQRCPSAPEPSRHVVLNTLHALPRAGGRQIVADPAHTVPVNPASTSGGATFFSTSYLLHRILTGPYQEMQKGMHPFGEPKCIPLYHHAYPYSVRSTRVCDSRARITRTARRSPPLVTAMQVGGPVPGELDLRPVCVSIRPNMHVQRPTLSECTMLTLEPRRWSLR